MTGPELQRIEETPRVFERKWMFHSHCPKCGEDRWTGWGIGVVVTGIGWCPPCREREKIRRENRRAGSRDGRPVEVVAVSGGRL